MLEAVLSEVLERVLGRYVRGIDRFRVVLAMLALFARLRMPS
jgi:hypothetical protein